MTSLWGVALHGAKAAFLVASMMTQVQALESTEQAKFEASMLRLNALQQMTVGPADNYQGVASASDGVLYFTRSWKLSTQLYRHSLSTTGPQASTRPWSSDRFDTQEPALSPSGQRIAYVSFENRARGQVCVQDRIDDGESQRGEAHCFSNEGRAVSWPKWLGEDQLLYIGSQPGATKQFLVKLDVSRGDQQILFEDLILAFAVHPTGRYLVYTSRLERRDVPRALKVFDMNDAEHRSPWVIALDLPGLPGFPAFTPDGDMLYFSQYVEDTNHDGRIDGDDHSVLYRIDMSTLDSSAAKQVAEQLTTVGQDCSYVHPTTTHLFLTCASRGSLDIYRLPGEGVVPASWGLDRLEEAYRVSRSLSERAMLLHVMRYRFPAYRNARTLERLISVYVLNEQFASALYYLQSLRRVSSPESKLLFDDVYVWLTLKERLLRGSHRNGPDEFRNWLARQQVRLETRIKQGDSMAQFLQAAMLAAEGREVEAARIAGSINLTSVDTPMQQFLVNSLQVELSETIESWSVRGARLLLNMTHSPLTNVENRTYYAIRFLESLMKQELDRDKHFAVIDAALDDEIVPADVKLLIRTEKLSLQLAKADDEKRVTYLYRQLSRTFGEAKKSYFLLRAMFVRSAINLMRENRHELMSYIANRWLSGVKHDSLEYVYARQQYVETSYDRAYGYLFEGDPKSAMDLFYYTLRLTDDAEAHINYAALMQAADKGAKLEQQYAKLLKNNLTGSNEQLVRAIVLATAPVRERDERIKRLKEATDLLVSMEPTGFSPAIRHSVLGALYHCRLILTRESMLFDSDLSEKAHRHYMIAYDLAADNNRIVATLLLNLGHLHQVTRNYGQSVAFLAARQVLGFVEPLDEVFYHWLFARSLYYVGEYSRALSHQMQGRQIVWDEATMERWRFQFSERAGFYAMMTENYEQAEILYDEFLSHVDLQGDQFYLFDNRLRAMFNLGYVYFKSERFLKAKSLLERVIGACSNAPKQVDSQWASRGPVHFTRERIEAMAHGLLVQMTSDAKAESVHRQARMDIMSRWLEDPLGALVDKQQLLASLSQDCNGEALAALKGGHAGVAAKTMSECLNWVDAHLREGGSLLHRSVRGSVVNAMLLLVRYRAKSMPVLNMQRVSVLSSLVRSAVEPLASSNPVFASTWLSLGVMRSILRYEMHSHVEEESPDRCVVAMAGLRELRQSVAYALLQESRPDFLGRWMRRLGEICPVG